MTPSDDALKARFLADLAEAGIVLPADDWDAVASDFLVLHRQIELVRDALPAEAPLPLGFAPGAA